MWPFNKKKSISNYNLLAEGTDYHSHILPGVDDGVQTLQESLHTLDAYSANGIKELWLTPHVMEDFPNNAEKVQARFYKLCNAYKGDITLRLASEYMIDNFFDKILENGTLLPIGNNSNYLLVETSYFTPPMRLKESLQRIKSRGYHPLLAHPERYMYMDRKYYYELQEMGIELQLNLLSLAGVYGRAAQKNAYWLLRNNMYKVAGSDLHCVDGLDIINNIQLDKATSTRLHTLLRCKL